MKKIAIFFIILFPALSRAQIGVSKHALDSLRKRILVVHDTAYVNTLNEMTYHLKVLGELDSVDTYAQKELDLGRQLHYKRGVSNATYTFGLNYRARGNYPKSKELLESALKLRQEMYDSTGAIDDLRNLSSAYNALGLVNYNMGNYADGLRYCIKAMKFRQTVYASTKNKKDNGLIAQAQNNMGIIYFDLGNYPAALDGYLAALQVYIDNNDSSGIAVEKNNIGNIYLRQDDLPNALKYEQEALAIQTKLGNKKEMAQNYANIGVVYRKMGDTASAFLNYQKAYELRKLTKDEKGIATIYGLLANLKLDQDQFPASLAYYELAIALHREQNDRNAVALNLINEGTLFFKMKEFDRSRKVARQGLDMALEDRMMENAMLGYEIIARDDSAMGDFKQAFLDFQKFLGYSDSLVNEASTQLMVRSQMNFEFDNISAQEKAERDKRNAVAAAEKGRKQVQLYIISAGFSVIFVFAIFMLASYRRKRRTNIEIHEQKKILEMKQKEILDSIRYAKRIQDSLLPTEKYIHKSLEK